MQAQSGESGASKSAQQIKDDLTNKAASTADNTKKHAADTYNSTADTVKNAAGQGAKKANEFADQSKQTAKY